ncbi:MAG TPA: hypothetical protein VNV41_19820 [Candidatus Acidoferrales bacterium]|jgi:hypothetical protein|nr:hypothetical protein [Candidatus Acidoferrales bacterium]
MKPKPTAGNEIGWSRRVATLSEARKYIDATGFCMLFPVTRVPLPSLYCAVTRRHPTAGIVYDKHFLMLWRWKDDLPRRRRAFYAKYFRTRGTLISLEQLPYFLALCDSAVAPGDHARFYSDGRIRNDARVIWEALEKNGPLATLELRHLCQMETKAGNVRFKRAMLDLQCLLVVVHFGSEQETGAWASGRFELTCRVFPEQTAAARSIAPDVARARLAAKYLEWHPTAPPVQLARLFGWSKDDAARAMNL